MNPTDPLEMMADMEPGSVLYGYSSEADLQIEILIRETSAEILAVGPKPEIQIRAGLLQSETVWVTALLLRLRPDGPIYDSWWNYHHPTGDPSQGHLFDHMGNGDNEIILKLVGDKGTVERLMPFRHPLQTFFRQAVRRIKPLPSWTMEQFLDALDAVREKYEDAEDLWSSL